MISHGLEIPDGCFLVFTRLQGLSGKLTWTANIAQTGFTHWDQISRAFVNRFFPTGSAHFQSSMNVEVSLDRETVLTTVEVVR